jgi:tight adherence protein C
MLTELTGTIGHFVETSRAPLLAASVFGFVFLAALATIHAAQARRAVRKRAIAFNPVMAPVGGELAARRRKDANVEDASELLFAVEKGLGSTGDRSLSKIRRELIRAGYFGGNAVFWFYVARFALAGALALAFVRLTRVLAADPTVGLEMALAITGACIGLLLPALYLKHRHGLLRQQCRLGFPNFLDLLVVCAEAGLTPRAGIERVSREITRTHPFLGANLFLMNLELQAGRPLVEAIEGLGRRVQLDEVRSLGSLLQQTEELGTNLTSALRVFSDEMRARRLLRAEGKAHSLPVKLVLPLAFFVFPVMLVVTLMPVAIRIQKAFF